MHVHRRFRLHLDVVGRGRILLHLRLRQLSAWRSAVVVQVRVVITLSRNGRLAAKFARPEASQLKIVLVQHLQLIYGVDSHVRKGQAGKWVGALHRFDDFFLVVAGDR